MTIKDALHEGRTYLRPSTQTFALDAELLLAFTLKKDREFLLAHSDEKITESNSKKFHNLLIARYRGVPVPYLTGNKEFFGKKFIVNNSVLVPRPETEAIVEETIKILSSESLKRLIVADIGTGSGVIAVSVAVEFPKAQVIATDRSRSALRVAQRNAKRFRAAKRIVFYESDLLNEIPEPIAPSIIVANLPYITSDDLKNADQHPDTKGLTFEPQGALDGGPDGLAIFRRFFAQIKRLDHIRNNVEFLILEHNPKQKRQLSEMVYEILPNFKPQQITQFVTRWN